MRTIFTVIALLSAFLFGSPLLADDPDYQKFDEQQMKMHNDEMEAHLAEMQVLMDKLHATNDPAERRRLLEAHRNEMSQMMQNMRSSREDMIMGMMGGGGRHGSGMPEGEKQRQYMIEKRLDMMDQMMQMMMERDQMMMHH